MTPSTNRQPLPRTFYDRPTLVVARELLGCWLVHDLPPGRREGRIVETEAYVGPDDRASHASRGRTSRTEVMFGRPGCAYVYLIYGMHHCLNVVTEAPGFPAAVLLRALEPGHGVALPTNGPGRLCRALGIDRGHDGQDLVTGPLWIERRGDPPPPAERIVAGRRIGVDYAGEWAERPWRFFLADSPHVSVRSRPDPRGTGGLTRCSPSTSARSGRTPRPSSGGPPGPGRRRPASGAG